ncbi:MAG: AMP-binding protein [Candidatus Schekmanbacteria bacterium]|nr:AMP-binding protein [Candidatus Schekmanbacteria bacterium]
MTLVEMLENNAGRVPDKAAVIFHNTQITYSKFNETVNRLASFLIEGGIKKGDRVGLMLPRIPELVISFMAAAKAQGVAVPINFELFEAKIRGIFEVITPKCLIVHASFLDIVGKSIPENVSIKIITVGNDSGNYIAWDEALKNGKPNNPGLEVNEEDLVYLNYTSGSTGNPKGAITSHSNIYYNTIGAVEALGLTPEDIHLCMFAPFAHPHEIFARPVYLGGTMVFVDNIYPKSLAEAVASHRVSCVMGLAPMYENLLEALEHKAYDLSSLRIPESGGMFTRPELIERFRQKLGVPIIPVWGSTETTGIALANRPGEQMATGSAGRLCPYYAGKIVDEHGAEVPTGETGEMIFKSPAVVKGYYAAQPDDSANFNNGWYFSEDLGRRDEAGNFYFVERKTGMMKVAGLKVYPLEIELALMGHADVKEAAVISVKDRLRGEVPKAFIVPKNGKILAEKDILRFCKEQLPHYKLPKIVEIRESLPKIGSGKINKNALQQECA